MFTLISSPLPLFFILPQSPLTQRGWSHTTRPCILFPSSIKSLQDSAGPHWGQIRQSSATYATCVGLGDLTSQHMLFVWYISLWEFLGVQVSWHFTSSYGIIFQFAGWVLKLLSETEWWIEKILTKTLFCIPAHINFYAESSILAYMIHQILVEYY